jgi:hypothetical protein
MIGSLFSVTYALPIFLLFPPYLATHVHRLHFAVRDSPDDYGEMVLAGSNGIAP